MKYQYGRDARSALERAKIEMSCGDIHRLRYAALELRMALECVTYERAQLYASEISPDECSTWQPGKLLAVLVEIEPDVNRSVVLRVRREATETAPVGDVVELGDDTVIPMRVIKNLHHALGNLLHTATMAQLSEGKAFNEKTAREKCEETVAALEKTLASKLRATFGEFRTFKCIDCDSMIRRRVGLDGKTVVAKCYSCSATYDLVKTPDSDWQALPNKSSITCVQDECKHIFAVWTSELKVGGVWNCPACATAMKVGLNVSAILQ
ncbi:hypothetical protein [Delftia acidovorans]|uniref:hypothetical protein n=1 Tax=Delftia acidovorans TaxID=80866 RepID=UPI0022AB5594|nr:hypothetical protein [Delftia acidovorans]WAT84890.1 hypothetical protein O1V13_26195 [Delftia acidovorans]